MNRDSVVRLLHLLALATLIITPRLVAVYHWADRAHPEPHIAATRWMPSNSPTR